MGCSLQPSSGPREPPVWSGFERRVWVTLCKCVSVLRGELEKCVFSSSVGAIDFNEMDDIMCPSYGCIHFNFLAHNVQPAPSKPEKNIPNARRPAQSSQNFNYILMKMSLNAATETSTAIGLEKQQSLWVSFSIEIMHVRRHGWVGNSRWKISN